MLAQSGQTRARGREHGKLLNGIPHRPPTIFRGGKRRKRLPPFPTLKNSFVRKFSSHYCGRENFTAGREGKLEGNAGCRPCFASCIKARKVSQKKHFAPKKDKQRMRKTLTPRKRSIFGGGWKTRPASRELENFFLGGEVWRYRRLGKKVGGKT